ncbi:Retrovirus-related Pol polyprotein from transposon TNT 1-94 [Cucumis melo var. makuwa]|uniref:Retrovirus-related Pol polyprotein from transposon TNT 1-94 n=1 Tax=Cucumis melo var. makuwa TaxID=1194695 RepID=A0A5A7U120_CUCMM|nr:Retrovirus-related Pol polyprotein from transposon TNT 1-94 [Cucumis melo var. makuwa]
MINCSSYELILLVKKLIPIIEVNKQENMVDIKDEEEDRIKDMIGGTMKTITIITKRGSKNATRSRGQEKSRSRAPRNKRVEEKPNYIENRSRECDTLLMACSNSDWSKDKTWYPNMGTSNHMCVE